MYSALWGPQRGPRANVSQGLVRRGGARYGSAWSGPACFGLARQGATRHATVGSRPDGMAASHAHRVLPPKSGDPAVARIGKSALMTIVATRGPLPRALGLGILGNVASWIIPCQPRNGPKPQVEALKVDDHRPFGYPFNAGQLECDDCYSEGLGLSSLAVSASGASSPEVTECPAIRGYP